MSKTNKLSDAYHVSGKTIKGFLKEIRDMSVRTTYPLVSPSEIRLLSFKEKIVKKENKETKKTYVFYVLGRENLSLAQTKNAGFPKWSFVAYTKDGKNTPTIELMDEIIRVSGLIMAYKDEKGEEVFNGVSGLALLTLCKRAGVPGDRARFNSLWRDAYIAEGLSPKTPEGDNIKEYKRFDRAVTEGIKLVVRHNATYKDGKVRLQKIGMILGVFGENYNESGMRIIADIYNNIKDEKKLGKMRMARWDVSQDYTSVSIEFPEAANDYKKKYGLKEKLIPGITIRSSDCGLSSLNIAGTYRAEDSECITVVSEYSRKHTGDYKAEDIMPFVNELILEKMEEFPKMMGELCKVKLSDKDLSTEEGYQRFDNRVRTAIRNGIKFLDISKVVGRKRATMLAEVMPEYIDPSEDVTLYDVAKLFMCLEETVFPTQNVKELGETAHHALSRLVSEIPKTNFFDGLVEGSKEKKKTAKSRKKVAKKDKEETKDNEGAA